MAKIISKSKIILLAILVVAAFLRFYKLTVNPISLFGDELEVGYQAYSILETGKDYYGNFLPIHFHSLAEWRTPLYLYSAVPTVAIWGITPLGIRVPAAFFGVLGVLAIYLFTKQFLKNSQLSTQNVEAAALISSFLLAVNPWHLQYSRAGFEVTQMLFFLLVGLWLFLKLIDEKKGNLLWLSTVSLVLTPWVYSTAKFFTPFLLLFLFILYRKEILSFSKKYLIYAVIAGVIVGMPIAVNTLFGGGTDRFGYISVFTDPVTESEVGEARLQDARMRGTLQAGTTPKLFDRVFHNKFTFWGKKIIDNMLQPFSSEFLFISGDPNPRQSIGIGQFYKIDSIFLLIGAALFLMKFKDKKAKLLLAFWTIFGVVPAALTRDGGNHATRLIIILPPLIFLISYALTEIRSVLSGKWKVLFLGVYSALFLICFINYQHNYWVHYPYSSERWWHAGLKDAFDYLKSVDGEYDRVFLSMQGEPMYVFFAAYYQYPPDEWQEGFPFKETVIDGFGRISYIDKYYFGSPNEEASIYDLQRYINSKDLYLAVAGQDVGWNLILDPGRIPTGLKLLKSVSYPSGEPAYYIFTKE